MIRDYQEIINVMCDRFNNSLSQLDVIAWLENFDKADWKKALTVLSNFEYYSTKDTIKEYENGLKSIIENTPKEEKIFLLHVGKLGKSGTAMVYYLKKTPLFEELVKRNKIEIIENKNSSVLKENSKIVMVDDFSGTGKSILDFYQSIKADLPEKHIPIALTVAFMEKAESVLNEYNILIVGNKRYPVFSDRGSVFGYYPKMKAIREFCFNYGNELYPKNEYDVKKSRQHPFGYLNTQALVGFEHSIPNNTLSIIWAECKNRKNGKQWIPLFPRRGNLIIERSKEFKQNQRYWVSIAYKLGLENYLFDSDERYNSRTVQLVSILYLKRKQKNDLSICQNLGLNIKEYESIISVGKKKDLFDDNEELTEQAINIIEQIRKKIKFQQNNQTVNDLKIEEDMIYIPKIFRGNS